MSDSWVLYMTRRDKFEKLKYLMKIKNLDRERISKYVEKFTSASYFQNKTPWAVECDIALPCATQNELGLSDAKNLIKNGCICVGEGANMPTKPDAISLLIEKKILFARGGLNAGRVAVSGLKFQNYYDTIGAGTGRFQVKRNNNEIINLV